MEQVRKVRTSDAPAVASDFEVDRPSHAAGVVKPTHKRALIVESAPSSLRLCREILDRSGFFVESAASGIAALTSARDYPPDVIVMDVQLPDVPGREFIGWLRDIPALRSTPIVILGGPSGNGAELAELGPNALLRRPASAMMIHRAIRDAVSQSH